MGGVLAILLLLVGKVAFIDPLAAGLRAHRRAGHDQLRRCWSWSCSLASVGVAAAGSGLSLRRFLRV